MAIRYENYKYLTDFTSGSLLRESNIIDGGGGELNADAGTENSGTGLFTGIENPTAGFFDQQLTGIPASIPPAVIQAAIQQTDTIVITPQVLVEGFGSYLADILPSDIAITAGAFGASMQQVKNISQIPIEKFAQVVASIETIQGLDLVNGTNIPVDITEAQAAYDLVALGTGPYKTFTYSDFYGCMSGLPYNWPQLQILLNDLQTSNLTNIYNTLYSTIVAGPASSDPADITAYNNAVQAQIDLANAEIALIRTIRPGASVDLNDLYDKFATQLGNEQRARNTGLSPIPDPFDDLTRDPYINKYPITIYSFVDSLPLYGKQTQPHMAAQTLEAISNLTFVAGQSIIATMREARNQDRLNYIGVTLDNNIPDVIEEQEEWLTNTLITIDVANTITGNVTEVITTLGNTVPAFPTNTITLGYYDPNTELYNVYDTPIFNSANVVGGPTGTVVAGTGTTANIIGNTGNLIDGAPIPFIVNTFDPLGNPVTSTYGTGRPARPVDTGGPKVPGSLAKSPYQKLIPPQLNTLFTSDVLLPAQYSVVDAIEQVIDCNCDCWLQ